MLSVSVDPGTAWEVDLGLWGGREREMFQFFSAMLGSGGSRIGLRVVAWICLWFWVVLMGNECGDS
jgi:hypothetical protein